MIPEKSTLLKNLRDLLWKHRHLFQQRRVYERALLFALGEIMSLGRHTTTQIIRSIGYEQADWSAWYRLFSHKRFNYEEASRIIFAETLRHVAPTAWYVVAVDGTQVPRSSRKMEGAHWLHNPLSPVFKRGIHVAQRWFHGSWLLPVDQNGYTRAIPLYFHPAFTAKAQPRYGTVQTEWQGALAFVRWLQTALAEHGRPEQRILMVGDGRYDTMPLWRDLPDGVVLLARSAKNRVLWRLPPADARSNRLYGARAPRPQEIWRQRTGWQALEIKVRGRTRHLQTKVEGPFLRQGAPHRPLFLIVVRGKHRKGRRRRRPLPFLVNAVWRAGRWQLPLPVDQLLMAAWQRWEIEVAHRELKTNFGLGEKQNWNPKAAVLSVQWSAWLYAVMLLAAWRTWQLNHGPPVTTRWWRGSKRWSFNTMREAYRAALWESRQSSPLTLDDWLIGEDWTFDPLQTSQTMRQAALVACRP